MMDVNLDSEPNSIIWLAKYIRQRRYFIDCSIKSRVDDVVLLSSSFDETTMQCSGGKGALRSMVVACDDAIMESAVIRHRLVLLQRGEWVDAPVRWN